MNQNITPLSAGQFAAELFPLLGDKETAQVAELYEGLGSNLVQEDLIQGEGT